MTPPVASYELCERMKELGFKQESYFFWATFRNESSLMEHRKNVYHIVIPWEEVEDYEDRSYLKGLSFCAAYFSDEVAEMLPDAIKQGDFNFDLRIDKQAGEWLVFYESPSTDLGNFQEKNLSDALAKMAIWLRENGKI